jgi:signal transduction histidine kinase
MRAVRWVLTVVGGCGLILAVAGNLARGDPAEAGWVLVGPAPFYVAGVVGTFRNPGRRTWTWLLLAGTAFVLSVSFDDAVVPAVAGSSSAWIAALMREWLSNASVVAGIGLIGLFPAGIPQRRSERWVLRIAAVTGAALPVLLLVSSRTAPRQLFSNPGERAIPSPLWLPAVHPLQAAPTALYDTFPAWAVVGVLLLYLRYRRSGPEDQRRIRWLLLGASGAIVVFAALVALAWSAHPGVLQFGLVSGLWVLTVVFILGSLFVALSQDAVLGIDRPGRRSVVYRALWLMILISCAAAAATLGVLASHFLTAGPAVVLGVGAALALQPAQRRLERLADRWVLGARLDGYDLLSRFGSMLEDAPGPADLLPELADAIRRGLGLQWARVRIDLTAVDGSLPVAGAAGIEPDALVDPALVVPLAQAGTVLGYIECGQRQDGPLLEEDRRLLTSLAGQAATALRNLQLTAELSARLAVIRSQAAALTASRARVLQAQDTERQRIQRDLHDGVQQDVVVLTAKLALARERLRRGDPRADEPLAELQRDLGDMLAHLREFAHAIHPPVLADQGLLEAIEAQAARLPIEVVIQADPALRGVRYPPHIEATTWFVVSEALTNVVKHAGAARVLVALTQPDGHLAVEVRDDGCGFDQGAVHGLGLAGLADRISIANGALRIDSQPGRGTTLCAEVPLTVTEARDG